VVWVWNTGRVDKMKVGDIVYCKDGAWSKGGEVAVVVSEIRHGINASFVDILVKGTVVSANIRTLRMIRENR